MPSVEATHSLTTMRMIATWRLLRSPATICGNAAGSTTSNTCRVRDSPSAREVSSLTESTPRIPSRVFSSVGHTAANAMITTFIVKPMPNSDMAAGTSTGDGSTYRKYRYGEVASRAYRSDHSSAPNPTPASAAITYPASRCSRLELSSARAGPVTHCVHSVRRIDDSGGKYSDFDPADHTHQAAKRAAKSQTRVRARPASRR